MLKLVSRHQAAIRRLSIIPPRAYLHRRHVTSSIVGKGQSQSEDCSHDIIFGSICEALSKGLNWDSLSRKLGSISFTESLIQKVLLHLKEPINAKFALKFFHWSAHHTGSQHGLSCYCCAIHILVKARLLKDAKALLESVLVQPSDQAEGPKSRSRMLVVLQCLIDFYEIADAVPFAFDLFMQTCARLRLVDDVLGACEILDECGFGLSVISYNTFLHVMQKSEKPHSVWSVYEHMIGKRVFPNEVTYRIMVTALSKEGRLKKVLAILERILGQRCSSPGVVVNTNLVFSVMEEERIEDGLILLKRMMLKNMILDRVAFSFCIVAKVKMGNLDDALNVYEEMCKRGFNGNSLVTTCFISAYCKRGQIEEAMKLLQEMDDAGMKPYRETFDHLIEGCSASGNLEQSIKYCDRMIELGILPSCRVFNKMVEKLCSSGETKRADGLLTLVLDKGFAPDEVTYSHLATGYMTLGDPESILKLYYEMEHKAISPTSSFCSALITSLCEKGRLREADEYLKLLNDESRSPSFLALKALIASYLQRSNQARARHPHEEMFRNG